MGLLRFLLALSVIIVHSSPIFGMSLVGGVVAVQTFFIISGFYMSLIINEKYHVGGVSSYWLFLQNRILRIFPSYFTILFVTFFTYFILFGLFNKPISTIAYWARYGSEMKLTTILTLVFSNLLTIGQETLGSSHVDMRTGTIALATIIESERAIPFHRFLFVPQAWTLGIEIMFYLIAPFIVRRSSRILGLILVAALVVRIAIRKVHYLEAVSELVFFIAGCVSYKLYRCLNQRNFKNELLGRWGLIAFIATIGSVVGFSFLDFRYKEPVYFVYIMLCIPFVFFFTKRNQVDRFIGELSYPMYICHVFIHIILFRIYLPDIHLRGLILLCATVVVSIALYLLVDRPVDRYRQNRIEKIHRTDSSVTSEKN